MNETEKKYWKKVFILFGNDFDAWNNTDSSHPIVQEYWNTRGIVGWARHKDYFDTNALTFTQKFLDEVMTW